MKIDERFSRTQQLLGKENMERLASAKVAVFGLGGVGCYVVEALARSGIGSFVLTDHDRVCLTNMNRQLIATEQTLGRYKADVMKERIAQINPNAAVEIKKCFFLPETAKKADLSEYSYVVDAVDTVTAKIEIVMRARTGNVPVISCMGTGNKLDPTKLKVADIYETSVCPLARVMRRELKKRGVERLKVVYSTEKPVRSQSGTTDGGQSPDKVRLPREGTDTMRRDVPGSTAFVPAAAGLILAGEVVRDLISLP